jgi:hypothetical protein
MIRSVSRSAVGRGFDDEREHKGDAEHGQEQHEFGVHMFKGYRLLSPAISMREFLALSAEDCSYRVYRFVAAVRDVVGTVRSDASGRFQIQFFYVCGLQLSAFGSNAPFVPVAGMTYGRDLTTLHVLGAPTQGRED